MAPFDQHMRLPISLPLYIAFVPLKYLTLKNIRTLKSRSAVTQPVNLYTTVHRWNLQTRGDPVAAVSMRLSSFISTLQAPVRATIHVPSVTAHPSVASVPITVLLYNGPLLCGVNVGINVLKQCSRDKCIAASLIHRNNTIYKTCDNAIQDVRSFSCVR